MPVPACKHPHTCRTKARALDTRSCSLDAWIRQAQSHNHLLKLAPDHHPHSAGATSQTAVTMGMAACGVTLKLPCQVEPYLAGSWLPCSFRRCCRAGLATMKRNIWS